jgi:hypothetical protein
MHTVPVNPPSLIAFRAVRVGSGIRSIISTSHLLRLWVRFPVRPIPHVIERATLSDSVGFLRDPVSSYIHYKSPNIVYRANNYLVDAQLSIQYFIAYMHLDSLTWVWPSDPGSCCGYVNQCTGIFSPGTEVECKWNFIGHFGRKMNRNHGYLPPGVVVRKWAARMLYLYDILKEGPFVVCETSWYDDSYIVIAPSDLCRVLPWIVLRYEVDNAKLKIMRPLLEQMRRKNR